MTWTVIGISVCGGVLATIIAAHLMTRKSPQAPPPPEQKPVPTKVEVEIKLPMALYPSWYAAFPIELEPDPEVAEQLDALAHRLAQKERNASPVDQRRLEYVRFLVQSGRLTEDL